MGASAPPCPVEPLSLHDALPISPDFSNATTTMTVNGSTINGPGTITNVAGRTRTLHGSTLDAPSGMPGTTVIRASDSIHRRFPTTADSTLTLPGAGFLRTAAHTG